MACALCICARIIIKIAFGAQWCLRMMMRPLSICTFAFLINPTRASACGLLADVTYTVVYASAYLAWVRGIKTFIGGHCCTRVEQRLRDRLAISDTICHFGLLMKNQTFAQSHFNVFIKLRAHNKPQPHSKSCLRTKDPLINCVEFNV